jgi:hypothetical protein
MPETCPCGHTAVSYGLVGIFAEVKFQLTPAWPTRAAAEQGAVEVRAAIPEAEILVVPLCQASEARRDQYAKQAVSHLN